MIPVDYMCNDLMCKTVASANTPFIRSYRNGYNYVYGRTTPTSQWLIHNCIIYELEWALVVDVKTFRKVKN